MSTPAANVTTVMIADPHQLFRQSLATLIECDPHFRVVGEAGTGRDAITRAVDLRPDILLLDLMMPITPGLVALREISQLAPCVRTVLLAGSVGDSDIVEALQLGARGVLMKHATTEMLFRSLRAVMAGEFWVGRECVGEIVDRMRERAFPSDAAPRQATCGFTERQLQIISALIEGASNADIARQFSISATTVKYHLSHMFEKAGVSNRLELALFAVQHRLDPTFYQR